MSQPLKLLFNRSENLFYVFDLAAVYVIQPTGRLQPSGKLVRKITNSKVPA